MHMPMTAAAYFVVTLGAVATFCHVISASIHVTPWPAALPRGLLDLDIAGKLHVDPNATARFSTDYGRLTEAAPAAVLFPSSPVDVAALVRFSFSSPRPFPIAARGNGHSVRGQALVPGGVVVDMASLGVGTGARIRVQLNGAPPRQRYVDAGGEQLWIDVLREATKRGVAPRSWTDYLYLTVGGTLSNAGISGQAFRHGPQISNVYELDVITGKGDMITCSHEVNPDLFYGVLGGLGQLGIITRARVAVEPAPERVRWVRAMYTDLGFFTRDQELMISMMEEGFNYVEGQVIMENVSSDSFFSDADLVKVRALVAEYHVIYFLEGALYYKLATWVDQRLELLLEKLSFVPGLAFIKDVSYLQFLDRVRYEEIKLRPLGLWDVPHPWLNVFVPRSRIQDFETGVFRGILRRNGSAGTVLIAPTNKSKWDNIDKMSAAVPDEETFYTVSLLRAATSRYDWKFLDSQNEDILKFCDEARIGFKQYLPHYTTRADWKNHFGWKWERFARLKRQFDPKALLSPGQRIFRNLL